MRAAIYDRVSTDEQAERGHSIDEQERLGREHIKARGWELIDVFSDPGYSGATDQRPGLQQMLDRLEEIDVVVVWKTDRLARNVELFHRLTTMLAAANVAIESLTEHVDLTSPHGKAMAGVSAVFGQLEREMIAERVKAALKARRRKGKHNGGPAPDGWINLDGARVHDPDRAPVIELLFELAKGGVPDGVLARQLNSEGHRTRSGRPWTRRQVQATVTNPWHAGLVRLDDELIEAEVEPLIDPATWHLIQSQRGNRDLAKPEQHVRGRPAHRHLLAKLCRCGECGSPMYAVTSSYRRKDGSRARTYECRGYRFSDGTCSMKVDAEAIDTAVLEGLHWILPDFDRWVRELEDRHAAERDRLAKARDAAERDRDDQRRILDRVEDNFLKLDDEEQEKLRGALERARAEFDRSEVRAQATADALASVPKDVAHDKLLDFTVSLRKVIAGKLDGDRSVGELNCSLVEMFDEFRIYRELPEAEDFELRPDGLYVAPILRMEMIGRLVAEYDPDADETAPPLEWIEALGKSANTQE